LQNFQEFLRPLAICTGQQGLGLVRIPKYLTFRNSFVQKQQLVAGTFPLRPKFQIAYHAMPNDLFVLIVDIKELTPFASHQSIKLALIVIDDQIT
jgi:hypothetical protein